MNLKQRIECFQDSHFLKKYYYDAVFFKYCQLNTMNTMFLIMILFRKTIYVRYYVPWW